MMLRSSLYLISTLALALAHTGCSSRQLVHERGWVGGELVLAQPSSWKTSSDHPRLIGAFPAQLAPQYSSGLVVMGLTPASPLTKAGLRESDLILALDGAPIDDLSRFRKAIDATLPGRPMKLVVYREGKLFEHTVVVGRETFRHEGAIMIGIGVSTRLEFDLLPDPDFSLVALGFQSSQDRLQLDSPRRVYILDAQPESPAGAGVKSQEGWRAWLAVLSLSDHKQILSQEATPTPIQSRIDADE